MPADRISIRENTMQVAEHRAEQQLQGRLLHVPGSVGLPVPAAGSIECPLHEGRFDIRGGAMIGAPCRRPLETFAVLINDGRIHVGA